MDIVNVVGKYKTGKWYTRNIKNIKVLTIHHSAIRQGATNIQTLKTIQDIHQNKGWPGLSYHYAIMPDGIVYKINEHTDITWHDSINNDSIGILVHGYFHPPHNEHPTDKQLISLQQLIVFLTRTLNINYKNVLGHRERKATACPGNNLFSTVEQIRNTMGTLIFGDVDVFTPPFDTTKKMKNDLIEYLGLDEYNWFNKNWSFETLLENIDTQYELNKKQLSNLAISNNKIVELEDEIKILKSKVIPSKTRSPFIHLIDKIFEILG